MSSTISQSFIQFGITRVEDDIEIEEFRVLITNTLEINADASLEISNLGLVEII